MAVPNHNPVFASKPNIVFTSTSLTTSNTAVDGTGTITTVLTANATYPTRVDYIKVRAVGTNIATVMRFFLFDGSAWHGVFHEATILATTLSQTAALADNYITLPDLTLPPTYKIGVTIGTTVAAGFFITGVGADLDPT